MAQTVTLDEFLNYAQIKAYDVISGGNFKRHLSNARDNGDKWAIQMNDGQTAVQNRIRELFTLVGQLSTPQSERVHRICKDVMSCAQPPIKVLTGVNVCCVTGVSSEHCIDLTRAGKTTREVLVHPRFRHFFMLLWFCAKSEYIIRACTKQWVESRVDSPSPEDYTRVCEEYQHENQETNTQLFHLFAKGMDYLTKSLDGLRESCTLMPSLIPTAEFLAGHDTDDDTEPPASKKPRRDTGGETGAKKKRRESDVESRG